MSEGVRPVLVCLADVPCRNVLAFVRDRRTRELFRRADSLVLARAQARQAARSATSPARSTPHETNAPGEGRRHDRALDEALSTGAFVNRDAAPEEEIPS